MKLHIALLGVAVAFAGSAFGQAKVDPKAAEALMQIVRMNACDRMVLKLNRIGGFLPALQAITICENKGTMETTVECGALFIFIGAEPRTDWLGETVSRDDKGFVFTGPDLLANGSRPKGWDRDRDPFYLECSVPGIFAAGDVRANSVKRVASAGGEGAMAVTLVHRYLEAQ